MTDILNYTKSEEIFSAAQQLMPGGVSSPVRAFKSVGGQPIVFDRVKGPFAWDIDGNRYIDYIGSWGPAICGHAHPEVTTALQEAIEKGTSFGAPCVLENKLAEMVIDAVPSVEMVRFVNSGTEACMSAVRLARGFTGKEKIIKFARCYHGHSDSFLIQAGSGAVTFGSPNSPGVTQGTAKDTLLANYNDIEGVKTLIEANIGEIACIILEPVAGNMGCILPQDNFLQKLRTLCDEHNILLVFDEVMTGFRLAKGGVQELYNVKADIVTFGKVIGGGLPIGAYGGKKELMEQVAPSGPVYQAGTLSGNPIAVTAGIETLKLLTGESYNILEENSQYLSIGVQKIIDENEYPLWQERVGSMFSLYFHNGPILNTKDVANCDFEAFNSFFHGLLNKGVFIAPSQYETGFISLAHSKSVLDATIEKIAVTLEELFVHAS